MEQKIVKKIQRIEDLQRKVDEALKKFNRPKQSDLGKQTLPKDTFK